MCVCDWLGYNQCRKKILGRPRRTLVNEYHIQKLTQEFSIDANWDNIHWLKIEPMNIDQFAGRKPDHFPRTQAKLAYDVAALYVIFKVEDRFVRALAEYYQGAVYEDSCVEFFFTPGEDLSMGYFNLEINCGGTALFHHQKRRKVDEIPVSKADFDSLSIAHTLPKIVKPEIKEAVTWVVEYRLPFKILSSYTQIKTPQTGSSWRANLYKCADKSSHPHWLTWSPVDTPKPDFHRPEFFGRLIFD